MCWELLYKVYTKSNISLPLVGWNPYFGNLIFIP